MQKRLWVMLTGLCLALVVHASPARDLAVTKRLGPAGGVIEIPGYVKAIIPPGALVREVELSIRQIRPPASFSPEVVKKIVGPVYSFAPEIEFSKPAEIRLYYRAKWIPSGDAEGDLGIHMLSRDGERLSLEGSETGNPFPESDEQNSNVDEKYVSVLTTYWGIARLLIAV